MSLFLRGVLMADRASIHNGLHTGLLAFFFFFFCNSSHTMTGVGSEMFPHRFIRLLESLVPHCWCCSGREGVKTLGRGA